MAGDGGGQFTIDADGSLTFNPGTAFQALGAGDSATTSVTYTVSDGGSRTDTATVTVTVTGVNDAPIANDDTLSNVAEDFGQRSIAFATLTGNDSDVDGGPLTVSNVANAVGGAVSISGSNVLFTPAANFVGSASFDYTVSDGQGGFDTATARFQVTSLPEAAIFTGGNDTRNLNNFDLGIYTQRPGHRGAGRQRCGAAVADAESRADVPRRRRQ